MNEEKNNMELAAAEHETPVEGRPIEVITAEICFYKQQASTAILEIGNRLIEAKAQLNHGQWLPWLKEKVEFSDATANRFMRLAREYSNPSPVTDLGASKALALLALPVSEREDFVAGTHVVNGEEKTVQEMSRRELEQAIRERDEALKRAEEAERAGEDSALAMAELREKLEAAQEEVGKLERAEQSALDKYREADETADALLEELEELERRLEELRNAPAQVAVQTVADEEAVREAAEAARRGAEEQLRAKIEKAEKAKAKAEEDLAAARAAQEESAAMLDREKRSLSEQVRALQKELAVASSTEMTTFKLHFEQGQASIGRMSECIRNMEDAGDTEGAGKLKNAMRAMLKAALGGLDHE